MTKQELVDSVAEATGLSKGAAGEAIEATLKSIIKGIKAEQRMSLAGFGTFTVRERGARTGRNPRTGEEIQIAASKTVGFKPAPSLKESL
ncbi:MAG: DNA-binding protein HU-beta [Hyphomicrobiaceae bacterium]|jgi:DNA-binding protein HU-beta